MRRARTETERRAALSLGIASLVAGVVVLAWPESTVAVIGVLVGLHLLAYGLLRIVQSVVAPEAAGGERVLLVLLGLLSVVVGVLCLRHLLETVTALTLLLGLFWLAAGLVEVVRGVTGRSGADLVGGVLGTVAGLVLLCWPRPTVLVVAVLLGAWLMLFGLITAVSAVRSRRYRLA